MSENIILEKGKHNIKKQKVLMFLELIISIIVIVAFILFLTKIVSQNIIIHIIYPGLALNILLNGFIMLGYERKKIAIFDFIIVGILAVLYVVSILI